MCSTYRAFKNIPRICYYMKGDVRRLFVVAYATRQHPLFPNESCPHSSDILFIHTSFTPASSIHPSIFLHAYHEGLQACRSLSQLSQGDGRVTQQVNGSSQDHTRPITHTSHRHTRKWTMLPWGDCFPLHHRDARTCSWISFVFIFFFKPNIGQYATLNDRVVPLLLRWTWNWRGCSCIRRNCIMT